MSDRSAEPDPFGLGLEELDAETRRLLTDHVERLCREHGLEWRPTPGLFWIDSEGDRDERWFSSPSIQTEIDYFAAVHEVGHFVLNKPTFAPDGTTVLFENEEAVWRWTLENARVEHSDTAGVLIYGTFLSHEGQQAPVDVRQGMRQVLDDSGERGPMRFKA
jgi:hypothetical protein